MERGRSSRSGVPWPGLLGPGSCSSLEEPGACSRAYREPGKKRNRRGLLDRVVKPNRQLTPTGSTTQPKGANSPGHLTLPLQQM